MRAVASWRVDRPGGAPSVPPSGFFFPPWESIFQNDAERDQSFGHALRIYKPMMDWYLACGYQIVEVPRTSVVERCAFVLRALDAAAGA